MLWPFIHPDARVTQRYDAPRRRGQHRAWDVAAPEGSEIVAPEAGRLVLLQFHRGGHNPPDLVAPGTLVPAEFDGYAWYWWDRYGAIILLLAPTRWWLFAHVDPSAWWRIAERRALDVRSLHTWTPDERGLPASYGHSYGTACGVWPWVWAGERIGALGNSGWSTGPHCHLEIAPPGYADGAPSRIDPATIWPGR